MLGVLAGMPLLLYGRSMDYAELDPVIEKWGKALGSTLFNEWAGHPCRSFYVPGDPPFEVFQIWIEAPENGETVVRAAAVDTNDDTEDGLEGCWRGKTAELDGMIEEAVRTISDWKSRPRNKPDPPSPW